jgi:hypothetical protein
LIGVGVCESGVGTVGDGGEVVVLQMANKGPRSIRERSARGAGASGEADWLGESRCWTSFFTVCKAAGLSGYWGGIFCSGLGRC